MSHLPPAAPRRQRRVLVVDDEPVIRLFLQELFEDEGHAVVAAQSIAEGLEALRQTDFDLVITDKNLPDGTGFEIVHAAREQSPPCEAMIITGYASLDSAVMALQIGAFDYILKPIEDVDLLLEKARKAMEKQDLWRELTELRARVATAPAIPAIPDAPTNGLLKDLAGGRPQLLKLAELGSMVPMLAHEMRQPLAGIKGHVDLLLHRGGLEPPLRERLESMRQQLKHMAGIMDSITSYSRPQDATSGLVDLHRPIDLALSIFPALKTRSHYRLDVDVAAALPPMRGNVNALQQVLVNLIKNAKDAVDEDGGGLVRVRAWHDAAGGELKLRVEDSGPGIPPEFRQRLFQPFFTTKEEGVGTGLGLPICRQIVADHGGRIEIETPVEAGKGTAFTLSFPVATVPEPAPQPVG